MTCTQIGRLYWTSVVVFKSLLERSFFMMRIKIIYVITGNCGADLLVYLKHKVVSQILKYFNSLKYKTNLRDKSNGPFKVHRCC